MTNIIFLDIDECFNNIAGTIRCRQLGLPAHDFAGFNPVSIALLRELCSLTDAKIVLSSTWRMHYKTDEDCINEFEAMLEKYFQWPEFPIIGRTSNGFKFIHPKTKRLTGSCRGDEIKQWLDLHDCTNYVIIDDSKDFLLSQKQNFVKVHWLNGFDFNCFQRALKILKPDENKYLLMK
jgi:hypothetical protein